MAAADDWSALYEQGKRALDDGLMANAHRYFLQAQAADPTHAPTATIVARLQELLDMGDEEVDEEDLSERSFSFGDGALSLRITSDERGEQATGAELWASGPALLEWLCSQPALRAELVEGRAVLELGSGTGVAGLGLRGLGAESVLLTDLPQRLPLLKRNVAANGASGVEARGLAWGSTNALPSDPVSLLVATDVTYDEDLVRLLAPTAAALLRANPSAAALFANPRRADFEPRQGADGEEEPDYALLFDLLEAEGLPPAEKVGSVAVAASERRGRVQTGVSHVDIHLIRRA